MLVTDVGDQMCWLQVWDVGDKSGHPHQVLVTNIKYQSPTSSNKMIAQIEHQHIIANIELLYKFEVHFELG